MGEKKTKKVQGEEKKKKKKGNGLSFGQADHLTAFRWSYYLPLLL